MEDQPPTTSTPANPSHSHEAIALQYESKSNPPPVDPPNKLEQFLISLLIGSLVSFFLYIFPSGGIVSPIVLVVKLLIVLTFLFIPRKRMISAGVAVSILVGFMIMMITCGNFK